LFNFFYNNNLSISIVLSAFLLFGCYESEKPVEVENKVTELPVSILIYSPEDKVSYLYGEEYSS
jgi:hypothetical protein